MSGFYLICHLLLYYISWFACVLGAAQGLPWLGPSIVLPCVIIQYVLQYHRGNIEGAWFFISVLPCFGFLADSFLVGAGLFEFAANPWAWPLAPPWMVALWVSFGMLFYACLGSLLRRYGLLSLLSFVAFPLAYWLGVKFEAALMPKAWLSLLSLGLIWAMLLTGLTFLYNRYIAGRY